MHHQLASHTSDTANVYNNQQVVKMGGWVGEEGKCVYVLLLPVWRYQINVAVTGWPCPNRWQMTLDEPYFVNDPWQYFLSKTTTTTTLNIVLQQIVAKFRDLYSESLFITQL